MIPSTLMELLLFAGALGGAASGTFAVWRFWLRPVVKATASFYTDVAELRVLLAGDVLDRLRAGEESIDRLNDKISERDERFSRVAATVEDIDKKLTTHISEFEDMKSTLCPKD